MIKYVKYFLVGNILLKYATIKNKTKAIRESEQEVINDVIKAKRF